MSFARKLIAVLALLCLTGAQQAAFAHWAVHLAAPAVAAAEAPDQEHGTATTLTQLCKGCIAFSGLDAALPAAGLPPTAQAHAEPPAAAPVPAAPFFAPRHFDPRAPPVFS